jgi:hypothetical protein
MKRKAFIIASLVAAVGLAVAVAGGVVLAQTPSPGGSGRNVQGPASGPGAGFRAGFDSFLNGLAQNLGVSRPALDGALKTTAKQQVDQAVAAGRLTQDQADKIKQRIDSGQGPFGFGLGGFDRGARRGGPGGGPGATDVGVGSACRSSVEDAVTSTLGVSASDLQQARKNGESITQIAQDHGKTFQDLKTAVTSATKGCLDQQVQAGKITSDQEQTILQRIQNGPGFPGGGRGATGERRHAPNQQGGNQ